MRLFPGGEHIPWKRNWAGRALVWLIRLGEPTFVPPEIEAGGRREIFREPGSSGRNIINICYEILFADSSGVFIGSAAGRGAGDNYSILIERDGAHGVMRRFFPKSILG